MQTKQYRTGCTRPCIIRMKQEKRFLAEEIKMHIEGYCLISQIQKATIDFLTLENFMELIEESISEAIKNYRTVGFAHSLSA